MAILDEIFTHQRSVVGNRKKGCPLSEIQAAAENASPPLDFLASLNSAASRPALIAEVKRRSPSRGMLIQDFDPLRLAKLYAQNGASAISVLTEEKHFGGHLDHLRSLANQPHRIPLLRKDFICDPYQVYESRAAGADAVLLIVAGLESSLIRELHNLVLSLHMTPLMEIHSLEELRSAMDLQPVLLGINNRDLRDFSVKLETTRYLRPYIPPGVKVVAESGIHTEEDVIQLGDAGVDAILVGEALVSAADVGAKVRQLSRTNVQEG